MTTACSSRSSWDKCHKVSRHLIRMFGKELAVDGEKTHRRRRGRHNEEEKHGSSGSHSPPQLMVVRTRQRLGPAHEGEAIRNETLEKLPIGCTGSSVLLAISRPFQHHFKGTRVPKQRHRPFLHGAGSTTKPTSLNPLKPGLRRFDPVPPQNLVLLSILSTNARLGQVSVGPEVCYAPTVTANEVKAQR